jgi:Ca2+/Na+ antiporter
MNSILVSALGLIDAALCIVVALAACDYLRRVRPIDQPLLSVAFYLVAIGAFGSFVTSMQGLWVNPFGVMLHAGVVVYAWAKRGKLMVSPD